MRFALLPAVMLRISNRKNSGRTGLEAADPQHKAVLLLLDELPERLALFWRSFVAKYSTCIYRKACTAMLEYSHYERAPCFETTGDAALALAANHLAGKLLADC